MARMIDAGSLRDNITDIYGGSDRLIYLADVLSLIDAQPTLTPPNEWVESLEAINNAAVAYIEGGPYENDLPGVELAVEINRLSRDFVRPPNEALPVLVNDEPDREYIDYICPRCKDIISQRRRGQRMEAVYQCKYHDNCGQRVDWNNSQPDRHPPEGEEEEKHVIEITENL